MHRDIKPANILLENGVERVKITDFGLARAVDDASITQSGVIVGTPLYMSPEQAKGLPVDARSDLFSLGSVLYALCTGHPPFRGESTVTVLLRVAEETPPSVREINPDIPDWLQAIIAKLHAKKADSRFQNAREVADLLEQHLAHIQQPNLAPLPATLAKLVSRTQKRPSFGRAAWSGLGYVPLVVVLLMFISGYSDAGWWATPWIEWLSACGFLGLAAWHVWRRPRWLAIVPVSLAVVFMTLGSFLWNFSTERQFGRLVRDGRYEEANRLLAAPARFSIVGGLVIFHGKDTSVTFENREMPLTCRNGDWGHYWYHFRHDSAKSFPFYLSVPPQQMTRSDTCQLYFTADQGIIRHQYTRFENEQTKQQITGPLPDEKHGIDFETATEVLEDSSSGITPVISRLVKTAG